MGKKPRKPYSEAKENLFTNRNEPLENEKKQSGVRCTLGRSNTDPLLHYSKQIASAPVNIVDWIISNMIRFILFIYSKLAGRYPTFLKQYRAKEDEVKQLKDRIEMLKNSDRGILYEKIMNEKIKNQLIMNEKIKNGKIMNEKIKNEKLMIEEIKNEKLKNEKIMIEKIKNEKIMNEQIKNEKIKNEKIMNEKIKNEKIMKDMITQLKSRFKLAKCKCVNVEADNKALEERVKELIAEKRVLERDRQSALKRLSEQVSVKFSDIVDLSDQFRPTKLAEMFSELYDDEWTSAYALLEEPLEEESAIVVLLDITMESYLFCEAMVAERWTILTEWFLDMNVPGAQQTKKWLKDCLKATIYTKVHDAENEYGLKLSTACKDEILAELLGRGEMKSFMTKCIELCFLMVTTDPPLVLQCPQWTSKLRPNTSESSIGDIPRKSMYCKGEEEKEDTMQLRDDSMTENLEKSGAKERPVFDQAIYKEYTRRGTYLDYVVWPALCLHKDGALLSKGIAQGSNEQILEQKNKRWTWLTEGKMK